MFSIGDKVVYPMHGAGIIEAIEEREILGKYQKYYIMRMPFGDMKVMVPICNIEEIGIRDIIDCDEADKVLCEFKEVEADYSLTWNKRYRENMLKIKSGDIYEVARVVKALMCRERDKGLSTSERKMLTNAKQIMISELVLAKKVEQDEMEEYIESLVEAEAR